MATSTASTTTPTQRPGWRTGTAVMSAGASPGPAEVFREVVVTGRPGSARGAVDHRVGDRTRADPPLVQDRLVRPVRDQRLHRAEDRVLGRARGLGDRDA